MTHATEKYDELPIRTWTLTSRDGEVTFEGSLLGTGSSIQREHSPHRGAAPGPGERCSACRWFDVSIYFSEDPDTAKYLVYTVGRTSVPGESDRPRAQWTDSALEIITMLTTRRDGVPRIPKPSERAITQAAEYDQDIYDAYRAHTSDEIYASLRLRNERP